MDQKEIPSTPINLSEFDLSYEDPEIETFDRVVKELIDEFRQQTPNDTEENMRLHAEISARKVIEAQRVDDMTKLPNKRAFLEFVEQMNSVPGRRFAIIFIDGNKFKEINDKTSGKHDTGDATIKATAEGLVRHVKAGDRVARLGGDEFAVLIALDPKDDEDQVVRSLHERMGLISSHVNQKVPQIQRELNRPYTASAGCLIVDSGIGMSSKELVNLSDRTLYQSKQATEVPGNRMAITRYQPATKTWDMSVLTNEGQSHSYSEFAKAA